MAVGKTKDGESFPAKPRTSYVSIETEYCASNGGAGLPSLEKPVPLLSRYTLATSWGNSGAGQSTHLSMTTAGVWFAMMNESRVRRGK